MVITLRRVAGGSMRPGFMPGRIIVVLAVRVQASRIRRIQVGDVVIVNHNGTELLKRVQRLRDGEVYVIGDDRAVSTDSRDFGWLPQAAITGKVVWPRR